MPAEKYMRYNNKKVVSVKEWLVIMVLLAIPIVNIVMLIYWSVSSKVKYNKRTYSRFMLILVVVIMIPLVLILCIMSFVMVASIA